MKKTNVRYMLLCALFAALSAVLAQVSVPIGPVPINMVHLSIFVAAGLLGAKYGTVSQLVYVLLGAVGLPVFSGFSGGAAKIAGPTGGFILGYILCAFVAGSLMDRFGLRAGVMMAAMAAGLVVTYIPGVIWFMVVTGRGLAAALAACVFPFLIGDAAKIVCGAILVRRLRPIVRPTVSSGFSA